MTYPEVDKPSAGLLGADLIAENNRWKIRRIYTTESWNPELSSPLDRPGIKIEAGYYLVGINGKELTATDDPWQFLDGTLDVQTTLHINKTPDFATDRGKRWLNQSPVNQTCAREHGLKITAGW